MAQLVDIRHSSAQVSGGWKHSAAVSSEGELYCWGWGGSQGSSYAPKKGGGMSLPPLNMLARYRFPPDMTVHCRYFAALLQYEDSAQSWAKSRGTSFI